MAAKEGIVQKFQIVPFIDVSKTGEMQEWKRIKKSTTFSLTMSPEVKTYDYISSVTPEEELDKYKPALSQDITMIKGEPDYQVMFDHLYELRTGAAAHRKVLIVFMQEEGTSAGPEPSGTVYKAWLVDSIVKINQLDSVAQTITADLAFNNVTKGACGITDLEGELVPKFTEGTWSDGTFTPKAAA